MSIKVTLMTISPNSFAASNSLCSLTTRTSYPGHAVNVEPCLTGTIPSNPIMFAHIGQPARKLNNAEMNVLAYKIYEPVSVCHQ